MAVVANACTTATGLYDPLEEIGHFCQEAGIWFHADACHGASALLSGKERHWLRGIERADSIVWDAHKMLRTSTVCTALLFKDATAFDRASHQEASYLFYGDGSQGIDLIHRTIECTKAELGLKLFLTLAWHGEQGIARYLENQYAMTRRFYTIIKARDQFECPYEPQSNILCFRYGTDDELQIRIRESLLQQGRFHLSSATIAGRRYLRLSVMSPDTNEETIKQLLEAIEQVAASIFSSDL
jgi:L-2,4-diaminobutyrate decarboxylase